jgi:hypothetical protein
VEKTVFQKIQDGGWNKIIDFSRHLGFFGKKTLHPKKILHKDSPKKLAGIGEELPNIDPI